MNIIRFIVVLKLYRKSVAALLEFARLIKTSMTGNTNFPTPEPPLADITSAINRLSNENSLPYYPGKTANVRQYAIELRQLLTDEAAYVESIANTNADTAIAVIESAGMAVKKIRTTPTNGFRLKTTGIPGQVQLRTDAEKRATFIFECTTTPDIPNSWTELYSGTRASFLAVRLSSGGRYYFRVAKVNKKGKNPWSTVINIIVP